MIFNDLSKKLYVVITMTKWLEVPRFRHEVSNQLSKHGNVLFLQIHSSRFNKRIRKKITDSLIVDKVGFSFPGLTRLFWVVPGLRTFYYNYLKYCIFKKVKKYGYRHATLINFQYDYPEVLKLKNWLKKIYFCNDDFIGQVENQKKSIKKLKQNIQEKLILNSDIVITVGEPLKNKFSYLRDDIKVIHSGHDFDVFYSKNHLASWCFKNKKEIINVCYMGVVNSGIATTWLNYVSRSSNIKLTLIGPLPSSIKNTFFKNNLSINFVNSLTGKKLQDKLLEYDVLVAPYSSAVENEITSVPAKLFQYLAVGKPVVTSIMPNIIELPEDFIYMSNSETEFLDMIIKAYKKDSLDLALSRIEFAKEHTWDKRGIQLIDIVNDKC